MVAASGEQRRTACRRRPRPQRRVRRSRLVGLRQKGQQFSTVGMLICMHSTSVRIDVETHEELKRLAARMNTTVGHTVTLAVRALRQERMGTQLSAPLNDEETSLA